jgi:glutathione peroxidase
MALLLSGSVAATPVAGGMLLVRITSSPKFPSCLARTSIHSLGSEASSFAFSSAALFTGASSKLFGASVSSSSKPVAVTRIVASRGRRAAGLGLLSFAVGVNLSSRALAAEVAEKSVYDHIVKDIKGNDVDLSIYKGKVLLIVNVASQCGFTRSNYKELGELYSKYKESGFEILAFPSNQFGGQEPGSNEQIKEIACSRFKAEFPIFAKIDVNGQAEAPLYKFLKNSKGGGMSGDSIKWNFAKFLVNKQGQVVERYEPSTSPLAFEKDIQNLLKA